MSGFNTNINPSSSSNLSAEAALRILSSKEVIESSGTAIVSARVSSRPFTYEQSGDTYYIANFPLLTKQQELKAIYNIQNGILENIANIGMSVNVSAAIAETIKTSHQQTILLEEVERVTNNESYEYSLDKDTGIVSKKAVPSGTPYKTLQLVASSIRPVAIVAVTTKKVDFASFIPAKVSPPVFGEETKATKKNTAELIADFEVEKP